MATLSGQTIANTFDSLLHVEDDTAGLVATSTDSRVIQDGVGAASALALATDSVRITSTNKLFFNDFGDEWISGSAADLTITSGNDIILAVGAAGSAYCAGIAGSNNTIFGLNAGDAMNGGSAYNTAFGEDSLGGTMTGAADNNTAIGYKALFTVTSGDTNTCIGSNAGLILNTGSDNVIIGGAAGDAITSTSNTVLIGKNAGGVINHDDAAGTVAIGSQSGAAITSGASNTAIGYESANALVGASHNVALGYQALKGQVSGNRIVAIGKGAMGLADGSGSNDSSDNIFIGYLSGGGAWADASSTKNVAIGSYALDDALNGANNNIAIGYQTMTVNTVGHSNTGVGHTCLLDLTEGIQNTAIGQNSMPNVTTGSHNTALGDSACLVLTTGSYNIGVGRLANYDTLTTGSHNICMGYASNPSASDSTHQFAFGNSVTGNADNSLVFGNSTLDSAIAFGATSVTAPSDERMKEDIQDSTAGLDFINDLRPITFKWRMEKDIPEELITHVPDSEKRFKNDKINHGFIAQEVKEVIDSHSEIKDGFDMWSEDEKDGRQRVGPGSLIPMLTKAVQELSQQVEDLKKKVGD